jgi:hypothetical protein
VIRLFDQIWCGVAKSGANGGVEQQNLQRQIALSGVEFVPGKYKKR